MQSMSNGEITLNFNNTHHIAWLGKKHAINIYLEKNLSYMCFCDSFSLDHKL